MLGLTEEFVNLLLVEQELPDPHGVLVHDVPVAVRADMAMVQKDLAVLHAGIAILKIDASLPKRFDLRSLQNDPGFQLLLDEIIVERLPVRRNDLILIVCGFRHDAWLAAELSGLL